MGRYLSAGDLLVGCLDAVYFMLEYNFPAQKIASNLLGLCFCVGAAQSVRYGNDKARTSVAVGHAGVA